MTDPSSNEDLPATLPAILAVPGLTDPAELRSTMTARVREYVTEARTERGTVAMQEDAYPLIRTLAGAADALTSYARVVADVAREVRGHVEDEALEAVGEADNVPTTTKWNGDGVPSRNVTVPDGAIDGEWSITRDFETDVQVDWHSLISVEAGQLAERVLAGNVSGIPIPDDHGPIDMTEDDFVHGVAQAAAEATLDRLLFLTSAPKPKTTALEAWAKLLGREGNDQAASIVASAWTRTRRYRGVKIERH